MTEALFDPPPIAQPYLEIFVTADSEAGEPDHYFACNVCGIRLDDGPCPNHAPLNVPGMHLAECDAVPRHPHTFFLASEAYPPPCMYCVSQGQQEQINKLTACKHWPWRRSAITRRINHWAVLLGISLGGVTSWGGPDHNRCLHDFRWRGKRDHLLGWPRWKWNCLLRERHWPGQFIGFEVCSKCVPCPDCGSSTSCFDGWCDNQPPEVSR